MVSGETNRTAVFLAGDSAIFFPAVVAIASIQEKNPELPADFFISFDSAELTDEHLRAFSRYEIRFVPTSTLDDLGDISSLAPMHEGRWPGEVFYNWLFPLYLEQRGYAFAMKIDYDILCMSPYDAGEISGFDSVFRACEFPLDLVRMGVTKQAEDRLLLPADSLTAVPYFNAGVCAINLRSYRELKAFDEFKWIYATLSSQCPDVENNEQVAWALFCLRNSGALTTLDGSYNVRAATLPELADDGSAKIRNIHFVTGNKPWLPADFTHLERYVPARRTSVYVYRGTWLRFASHIDGFEDHVSARVPTELDTLGILTRVLSAHYRAEARVK